MSARLKLVGQRFGSLLVISSAGSIGGRSFWKVKCDCGNECIKRGAYLTTRDSFCSIGCPLSRKKLSENRKAYRKTPLFGKKICTTCELEKSVANFYRDKKRTDGLTPQCKSCMNAGRDKTSMKKYQKSYREARTDGWRAEKYGISKEEIFRMEEKQKGLCAICSNTNRNNKRLGIDHCHVSGKVRGLLCDSCNTGLGGFKDSPKLLLRAISYLLP